MVGKSNLERQGPKMDEESEVTSKELMEAAGVTGINTLRKWVVRGLLAEPTIRKHPSGRGTISYWPAWVEMRAIQIRELREAGKSKAIDEILLKEGWDSVKRKYQRRTKRRYNFARACGEMEHANAVQKAADSICAQLQAISKVNRDKFARPSWTLDLALVNDAIELLKQGMNPVVIVEGDSVFVTSDVAVGFHLSKRRSPSEAFVVIPIADVVLEQMPSVAPLAKEISIEPSPVAIRRSGKLTSKLKLGMRKNWQVKIDSLRQ